MGDEINSKKMIQMEEILKLFLPEEIVEKFKLIEVVNKETYVEFVLEEKAERPEGKEYVGKTIELKQWETIELLNYPMKNKQGRVKLRRKRWLIQETGKTVVNPVPEKLPGAKISEEFGDFLKGAH